MKFKILCMTDDGQVVMETDVPKGCDHVQMNPSGHPPLVVGNDTLLYDFEFKQKSRPVLPQ
jgi:hypothetical protein